MIALWIADVFVLTLFQSAITFGWFTEGVFLTHLVRLAATKYGLSTAQVYLRGRNATLGMAIVIPLYIAIN